MLKENEYIRTDLGNILKYTGKEKEFIDKHLSISNKKDIEFLGTIVKHSKIISEVVEVGDYVNGKRIHKIDKGQNYCYLYYGNCKTFVDYQIKTILTKEMYESNCYTVERNEE